MPELPEVETVRAGIADHSLGRSVRAVRVVDARSLRRNLPGPAHFEAALTGRALRGAYRRGKYLWLTLSEADGALADRWHGEHQPGEYQPGKHRAAVALRGSAHLRRHVPQPAGAGRTRGSCNE